MEVCYYSQQSFFDGVSRAEIPLTGQVVVVQSSQAPLLRTVLRIEKKAAIKIRDKRMILAKFKRKFLLVRCRFWSTEDKIKTENQEQCCKQCTNANGLRKKGRAQLINDETHTVSHSGLKAHSA